MTHDLTWTREGWRVTTTLGPITIAWAYFDNYGDALRTLIELQGGV